MSQYGSHCGWHGVICENGKVVSLTLKSNGLSGILSKEIAMLGSLFDLDLSDNDMKASHHHMCSSLNLVDNSLSQSFCSKLLIAFPINS